MGMVSFGRTGSVFVYIDSRIKSGVEMCLMEFVFYMNVIILLAAIRSIWFWEISNVMRVIVFTVNDMYGIMVARL